jgi:Tfp pilus assembly protein PilF
MFRGVFIMIAVTAMILAFIPWYSHHLQLQSLGQSEIGNQAEGLHNAENAVRINPTSIQARFILAGAQQRLGREVEARKTLITATEMQPLNYSTWEQLALYESNFWGEYDLAREHFERSISLNPMDLFLKKRYDELFPEETG